MKLVRLIGTQFQDLFGVVTLKPGDNEVSDADWLKVRDLKLGEMDIPFVEWARRQGSLHFEPDSPDAPQVVTFPPAAPLGPGESAEGSAAALEHARNIADPTFNAEAMTLEHKGETLEVAALGFADPDAEPASGGESAPVSEASEPTPEAAPSQPPAEAPKRRGRPPKNKPQA